MRVHVHLFSFLEARLGKLEKQLLIEHRLILCRFPYVFSAVRNYQFFFFGSTMLRHVAFKVQPCFSTTLA